MRNDRTNLARKLDDLHHNHPWEKPAGKVIAFKSRPNMATRIVDVYDGAGDHIAAYQVCLEGEDCLACEFEEVALVIAEQSGRVPESEIHLLVARCHNEF